MGRENCDDLSDKPVSERSGTATELLSSGCGEAVFASRFRSGRFRAKPLAAALFHLRHERFTAEWSPAVRAATQFLLRAATSRRQPLVPIGFEFGACAGSPSVRISSGACPGSARVPDLLDLLGQAGALPHLAAEPQPNWKSRRSGKAPALRYGDPIIKKAAGLGRAPSPALRGPLTDEKDLRTPRRIFAAVILSRGAASKDVLPRAEACGMPRCCLALPRDPSQRGKPGGSRHRRLLVVAERSIGTD